MLRRAGQLHPKEKILLYGSNLWNFADGMFGPLLAVFTERVGGNILDISSAWAIYLVVTGVFVIFVGKFSDHHSKEKIMLLGYALTAICTFSYIFVETPSQLFLVQAFLGLALGLCNPTWYALYDKYAAQKEAGMTWGLADGESKIFTGIAILIGGFIVSNFSFEALFVIMGIIQIIVVLYQLRLLKR